MQVYWGDRSKFKEFLFELFVAIGRVESKLGVHRRNWIKNKRAVNPEEWNPKYDKDLDQEFYEKYSGELYGLLVSKASGEAKGILMQLAESGERGRRISRPTQIPQEVRRVHRGGPYEGV